ncbi:hypothetical protein MAIC_46670 [Mycolicibacterium aichiense]|uniref:Secreted protein n=1 Tax=Mycolicibacterium aichiense TaxID=1799 RepID=A0AAD1HRY1_9MYCO|nr:hypothetical protein MAIC_46670 [Mycolicibacterium aichiense]STZ26468.1 Uncharacterised protein [Mycolicibacterium aichiense]
MKLTGIALGSVLATCMMGVGLAGPAVATDDITQNAVGTYDVLLGNQTTSTIFWTAEPCDNGADQCIKVSEFSSSDTARKKPHWTENAYWTVGSWVLAPVDVTRTCKDKTSYHLTLSNSWDAATNTGYRSYFEPGACDGGKPHNVVSQLTLSKVGPPLAPDA